MSGNRHCIVVWSGSPGLVFYFFVGNNSDSVSGIPVHICEGEGCCSRCSYLFIRTGVRIFDINCVAVRTGNFVPFHTHRIGGNACFPEYDRSGNVSGSWYGTYITFIIQDKIWINLYLIKSISGYWQGKGRIFCIKIFGHQLMCSGTLVDNLVTCNRIGRICRAHIKCISAGRHIRGFNSYTCVKGCASGSS